MSRRRLGTLAVASALVVIAAGCASTDPYVRTRGAEVLTAEETDNGNNPFDTVPEIPVDTEPPAEPESTIPDAGGPVFTLPADKTPTEYDDEVEAYINDIQNFWRNEYPAIYGEPYQELLNGVHALRPGDSVSPGCGEPRTDYAAVQGNAFYCTDTDFIAYDDEELMPMLVAELGVISIGVVMAHEWGHAIQARIGYEDETIYMEQQADCFAGAWAAHIARGESTEISFSDDELKGALNAMIFVRDPAGTTSELDAGAHGSAFDRVGAFGDGFRNGTARCAEYVEIKPTVIQFSYLQTGDQENAPLTDPSGQGLDIISIATKGLTEYWPTIVPEMPALSVSLYTGDPGDACASVPESIFQAAFYCAADGTIAADEELLTEIYRGPQYNDMGVAYVIATAWAEAVMDTIGATIGGEERALAADCFVGAFSRSALPYDPDFNPERDPEDDGIVLSPGDLDEAVSTAIAAADAEDDTDERGTPFEKIESFRQGVLAGYPACQERFGL